MKPVEREILDALRATPAAGSVSSESPSESPKTRSLLREILDWMLAPLLVVWPMSIAATYLVATAIANVPFDRDLEASVTLLAEQVKVVNGRAQIVWALPEPELLRADDLVHTYYQVLGLQGELVGGNRELLLPREEEPLAPGIVRFRNGHVGGVDVRIAYTVLKMTPSEAGRPVLIQVAETLEKRAQLANEIIKGVILPQFLILPIAAILVWFGLSRGLRPLSRLQENIQARGADDMRPIDPGATPEEIVPLVASFNQLLARLGSNTQDQRRFIANAAHQMRTPLAGLRTQAELALREKDPEEVKRCLQQLATSTERATRLINQLLSLARAENRGLPGAALDTVELGALTRDVVRDWVPAALEKRIDLGFEVSTLPAVVLADPVLLRELLKNLLDNAIRYTPPEGAVTVRVAVSRPSGTASLEVQDNGPGIPESERHLVFERFYRVLGSGSDGSGLGLAIVREIALQHGARIELLDPPGADPKRPGTVIAVHFPATQTVPEVPDY